MAVNPFDLSISPELDLVLQEATANAAPLTPDAVDFVLTIESPKPIGRSWAFDWQERKFVAGARARGPAATRGMETLENWIAKCLSTARGAHKIHPPGYGVLRGATDAISRSVGFIPADLAERVSNALTFHPRIADVRDFAYNYDPDQDWVAVAFTVVLDDESAVTVNSRVTL